MNLQLLQETLQKIQLTINKYFINPNQKKMKKLILFICFTLVSSSLFAQLRLDENFNYTAGDSLGLGAPANGWVPNSGGGTNPIFVTTPGLVYAGYPLSGIGEAITLKNTGQDKLKNFVTDSVKSGSVYASFMLRVDTARTGDYFFALLQSGTTGFYEGRVQVRSIDGSGLLSFGITKANSASDTLVSGIWTAHSYTPGVTYLLVLKYTFIPGTTNDAVSLYVLTSGLPAVEPAIPTIGPISAYTSADATAIGRIGIRQGTTSRAPNVVIDGIRVATSWFSTVLDVKYAVQGITNPGTSMLVVPDSVTVNVRSSSFPYAIIETSYGVIDPATLIVSLPLSNSLSGSYYLEMAYRRSAEFRNGINIWSSSNQNIAPYNAGTYNFTTSASQAYGDNQIQVGTVFTAFNGDVNQDETIDAADLASTENAVGDGLSGYTSNDVTGDDFVDSGDLALVENNVGLSITTVYP